MHWGKAQTADSDAYNPSERWDTFAAELGELVHRRCPRWVVVVEGVGHCAKAQTGECTTPAAMGQNMRLSTWWGENLQAAAALPVVIPQAPKKLLY